MFSIWIRVKIGIFYCLWSCGVSQAQEVQLPRRMTLFDLLQSQDLVTASLRTDLDSLKIMKLKPYESEGEMKFQVDTGHLTIPVKVTVRGKFRRRTCSFPPLFLNFRKGTLKDYGLKNDDEYKLVTHCLDEPDGDTYLLKEYLIYLFYRELDTASIRSLLLPVTYIQDKNETRKFTRYAVLLESNEELRDRLNGKWCDCMGLPGDSIDPYYRELVLFFQYMIGNKDMNMHIEHNVRFLEHPSVKGKIPIPYDFDFSAFVRAPYAFSDQSTTFDRSPLALGRSLSEIEKVQALFIQKEEIFKEIIHDFDLLPRKERKKCQIFMRDFYRIIKKPGFIKRYMNRKEAG